MFPIHGPLQGGHSDLDTLYCLRYFDGNSMVLYAVLHSMPNFLCRPRQSHAYSVKICRAWFAVIDIYENLWALWATMESMANLWQCYILWL